MATGDVKIIRDKIRQLQTKYSRMYSLVRELAELENLTYRDRYKRQVGTATHPPLDPALVYPIRAYEKLNPRLSNEEIGAHFGGLAGARISEALGSKTYAQIKAAYEKRNTE